ncbi:MAG: sensor histidine kinase [Beijerinckiaceae bacterium]
MHVEELIDRGANNSIARRLFVSAAFWSFVVLLVAGIFLSALYRTTAQRAFDDRLNVYLRALVADVALSSEEGGPLGQMGEPQFELTNSGWYWQVTRIDSPSPLIRSSRSLFAERLPALSEMNVAADETGLRSASVTGPDGRPLRLLERVIDIGTEGQWLIQVAATTEDLTQQIRRFVLALSGSFVLVGVALVGATALQVRYGLRPLRRLQDEVTAIRRGQTEKIAGPYPEDLAPLAGELNLLIASNKEVVERARTQVGNLAHALKTPLSVISNEAARDVSPLAHKVREQAAVMRDQVAWYLDRARAAARSTVIGASAEVAPSLAALVRTFEKIYVERGVAFEFDCPPGLRFRGERQDLEEMLGNLIDNAGKWASGRVLVTVVTAPRESGAASPGFLDILVEDDGPGLPAARRAEALGRGRRLDETKPGSGLGLSIVADLAKIYGGSLELADTPLGGLKAALRLPSA